MASDAHGVSLVFIELGAAIVGLALLARLAKRWELPGIPLYLLAGLAFGNGGLRPLDFSEDFIEIGGEIGVLLLLFMLGLEYTGEELRENLSRGLPAGLVDLALNFPPGFITGLLLGWNVLAAVLLGGVTYISSSGVIAKLIADLRRHGQPETAGVVSVLVLEDLAMALYLPLVAALLLGDGADNAVVPVLVAVTAVCLVLFAALRYGSTLSKVVAHESDEVILLTTFGLVLLVGGVAQRFQVSAAIAAFLVGLALSGPIAAQSRRLLAPSRDLFAAIFFFFFGLQIDPRSLPPVLPLAAALGILTGATKVLTGYWTARREGVGPRARLRAGMTLVARGEFSIVIAGLGARLEPRLVPLAAAYVVLLAVAGPILARAVRVDGRD